MKEFFEVCTSLMKNAHQNYSTLFWKILHRNPSKIDWDMNENIYKYNKNHFKSKNICCPLLFCCHIVFFVYQKHTCFKLVKLQINGTEKITSKMLDSIYCRLLRLQCSALLLTAALTVFKGLIKLNHGEKCGKCDFWSNYAKLM